MMRRPWAVRAGWEDAAMTRAVVTALVLAALVAGCGSSEDKQAAKPAARGATCAKSSLSLQHSGQLAVATDKPAYPPYFQANDPANGKGFESAVAYAIAGKLGFTRAQVKWVTEPFNSSYAPGPKTFDFDVNEISITPKRSQVVDFSAPYYTAPQAVVARNASKFAHAGSLAALAGAKIGVQIGTTSLDAVKQNIKPHSQPQVFNDSNDVVSALKNGQVDAVVIDLPTAFYLTSAQVKGARIVGQFDAPGGDSWGALLAKGSALTPCVTRAVQGLKASGQLAQITKQWMGAAAGAPELH
jgi:polar amino acid transport system substrate-binding protein